MRIIKLIFLSLTLIAATSCYTQRVTLNQDKKSGVVSIDYSFNDDDFEILSLILSAAPVGDGIGFFDPSALIDKNEFISYFNSAGIDGIKLTKADITRRSVSGVSVYKGSIVIAFDDFEELLKRFPAADGGFKFIRSGGVVTLEQKVEPDKMGDMETLDNYMELVKEAKPQWYSKFVDTTFLIEMIFRTPVLDSRGVVLSSDKRTARYSFKTGDMIGANRKNLDFMLKF